MTARQPTALIADDEPLLRENLADQLSQAWPELTLVAQARNGREAIQLFNAHRPDICFLDVQMPGLSGLEAARHIGRQAHLVFVTAYDHYAVQAFAEGVLDYLVKPVAPERLRDTVVRLQDRLRSAAAAPDPAEAIHRFDLLLARLSGATSSTRLRWIRAQAGSSLQLIPVEDVDYLRSDAKYTRVAWHDESGVARESIIRTALKDLILQLDPNQFIQVHRSVVVNQKAIRAVTRGDETAVIHLKARKEELPVSRSYLHLFRQM